MRRILVSLSFILILAPLCLSAMGQDRSATTNLLAEDKIENHVVLALPWGKDDVAAGRFDGDESASEGPMSFYVTGSGELYLLDQVNLRVLHFAENGELESIIPIFAPTFQDLVVTEKGEIILLDRLVRRSLVVLDPDGNFSGEFSVEGPGIPEGGGITAMFLEADGVWLEYAHVHMVQVLDDRLEPSMRALRPGRIFEADRLSVGARMDGLGGVEIWLDDLIKQVSVAQTAVVFADPIVRIAWIEADEERNLYVLLHVMEPDPKDPRQIIDERMVGLRYDDQLNELGQFESSWVLGEWAQFREFQVTRDGTVYQLVLDPMGVLVLKWRWR